MSRNYAFINCNLFDGNLQNDIQKDMTILVRNTVKNGVNQGLIDHIGKTGETPIPAGYSVVDVQNKYIIPGLINAHAHLFGNGKPSKTTGSEEGQRRIVKFINTGLGNLVLYRIMRKNAVIALNSGVTTIRCVGDMRYNDVRIRDEINNGKYYGPELLVSGPLICVTGGHGSSGIGIISDSPWEARRCVRQNVREGVELIKISVTGGVMDARKIGDAGRLQMTVEEVSAVCDEAHKVGMLVAAHVESKEGIRTALQGGVDTIEHGSEMDDEIIGLFKNNPNSLRGYSTLIATLYVAIPMNFLDAKISKISEVSKQNASIIYEGMRKGIKQGFEAGIKIGLGTDASMPYITQYNIWRDMDCLVKSIGITPKQAINLATGANAEILGIDRETGTLEAGKLANFIVLRNNPLDDLKTLSQPEMVVFRGNVINKPNPGKIKQVEDILDQITI